MTITWFLFHFYFYFLSLLRVCFTLLIHAFNFTELLLNVYASYFIKNNIISLNKMHKKGTYTLKCLKYICLLYPMQPCVPVPGPFLPSWDWRRPIRNGIESIQLKELKKLLSQINFENKPDVWILTADQSRIFSVASIRLLILENSSNSSSLGTSVVTSNFVWIKTVPIKVNILAWRIVNGRLPTRLNLDRRNIDLNSTRWRTRNGTPSLLRMSGG